MTNMWSITNGLQTSYFVDKLLVQSGRVFPEIRRFLWINLNSMAWLITAATTSFVARLKILQYVENRDPY